MNKKHVVSCADLHKHEAVTILAGTYHDYGSKELRAVLKLDAGSDEKHLLIFEVYQDRLFRYMSKHLPLAMAKYNQIER